MVGYLQQFEANQLAAGDFDGLVRYELRRLYTSAMLRGLQIGKFWRNILLGSERLRLSVLLNRQYGFWGKFWQTLVAQHSAGQAFTEKDMARLRTYPAMARGALEWGRLLNVSPAARVGWRLGSFGDEHCSGCTAEAAKPLRAPHEFEFVPGEGRTPCIYYCTCSLSVHAAMNAGLT